MSPRRPGAPRGVTLIELMITMVISGLLIVAIFGVVQAQQKAYYQGHLQRAAQGSARAALRYVEQRLQSAGWGMDAALAFDFDRYVAAPCPAKADPCARDRVDGNDELVFYSRNPRYWVAETYDKDPVGNAWRIADLAGNLLSVHARPGDRFVKGQVLQAVCKAGAAYAYFTVDATTTVAAAVGPKDVTLANSVASDPFRRQAGATDGCFKDGTARLFLIDRYRFHVRPVTVGGLVRPYLVLDRGLDANGKGADEEEELVVADGIETFQVAYVMTNGALASRGTVPGVPIVFAGGFPGATIGSAMTTLAFPGTVPPGKSEYGPTSWFPYSVGPPPAAERLTDHQANIRAVRIAIRARSPEPDPAAARAEPLLPVLNMNELPAWFDEDNPTAPPWARARVETTVLVRNTTARTLNDF